MLGEATRHVHDCRMGELLRDRRVVCRSPDRLQFVVITLIADMPVAPGLAQAADAFATPTIVHFGTVLLLSAVLSAPWHGIGSAAVLWGLAGFVGVV